jgi:hypothetical protein
MDDNSMRRNISTESLDKKKTHIRKSSSIPEIIEICNGQSPSEKNNNDLKENYSEMVNIVKPPGHSRKSSVSIVENLTPPRSTRISPQEPIELNRMSPNQTSNSKMVTPRGSQMGSPRPQVINSESMTIDIPGGEDDRLIRDKDITYNDKSQNNGRYFIGMCIILLIAVIVVMYYTNFENYVKNIKNNIKDIAESFLNIVNVTYNIDIDSLNNATKHIPKISDSLDTISKFSEFDFIKLNSTVNKLSKIADILDNISKTQKNFFTVPPDVTNIKLP